jgi:tetratricopeptide (TPR) repeat protein
MSSHSGNWFGKLLKKASPPEPKQDLGAIPKPTPEQEIQPGAPYKKGDVIGQKYEVYGILGKGGLGIVYLIYHRKIGRVYALKTFRDEFLANEEVRKRFYKEASLWVELEGHPYLVHANHVDEVSGRLYITMEYIAPNEEGLNSLEGYLQRRPPDLAQSLRWAIQVCHGMEYANTKGVRAHRDLKPANIMISQDMTAKITDFGLAGVASELSALRTAGLGAQPGSLDLSGQTMLGVGFGTPAYMAPEQFDNAAGCDERSDIYSFGVVLYQMAARGRVPFFAPMALNFWQAMRRLHCESPVPRLDSPLFPIIQHCLEKSPGNRYQTFKEVRKDLEPLLQHQTGESIIPPQLKELEAWEWTNKGVSLDSLGRYKEAIRCYDKALELDQHHKSAWANKGGSLERLCCHEEAIRCADKALEIDPRYTTAWTIKGVSLNSLGRHEEAIRCLDRALEIDPRNVSALNNKGRSLHGLNRYEEASRCYDMALEIDPRHVYAWNNKGNCLYSLNRNKEAIRCYDQALKLNPRSLDAWIFKGISLDSLGRYGESIYCYNRAVEIDPLNVSAWNNKALAEDRRGQWREAVHSYERFLAIAPAQYAEQIEYAHKRLRKLGSK